MTWKNEKKSKALLVVFGIYLALLVWCILFKFALRPEEIPHLRGINLIPYAASVVVNGKVQISEIIENMLVFLPFGLCISAFYPDSEIQNRILLASGLSLFFEVTQYIFAIGASDITDVIDNMLGAVIGILLYLAIGRTYEVLLEGNQRAAEEIIKKDQVVDAKEREIEDLCFRIILQQQPVARDLRQVSAALKMITDMERIGDQAADIADIVKVTSLGVPDASIRLKDMAKATASMVTKCIDAYVKQDLKLAREVIDFDDIVDDLFDEVKDEILQGMRKGITTDVQSLDYLMIAKYYERIGDHATNIAEWVVYSINGHHKGE